MPQSSPIQWCDSSCNMEMGCAGCELWNPAKGVRICYAGKLTVRHAGRKGWPAAFEEPKLFPERLVEALGWRDLTGRSRPHKPWIDPRLPRLIFLNDMGDTFTESLPLEWMAAHLHRMAVSPHVWITLTKRPARMAEFFQRHRVPSNFWLCTSLTNQASLGRIRPLLTIDGPMLVVRHI